MRMAVALYVVNPLRFAIAPFLSLRTLDRSGEDGYTPAALLTVSSPRNSMGNLTLFTR